jgi:predicted nucleotidyltransferase
MNNEQTNILNPEYLTADDILGFLRQNKQFIRERFYCSQIGLFGSFARNEQTDESDIDVLVRFADNVPDFYAAETELKEYLLKQFGRNVDICAEKWIKPVFRPLVSKDAVYA